MPKKRQCIYCSRLIQGRSDKVYCSDRCRFLGWKEGLNQDLVVKPCYYCGWPASTIDHVPPQHLRAGLNSTGLSERFKFYEVDACKECNCTILEGKIILTLGERKAYVKKVLRRRYRHVLATIPFTDSELAQFGPNLQSMINSNIAFREIILERLKW